MQKELKITLNTKKPIAFFDSGVGGLTVYSKLKKILPNENYIYFGDTKHMPYGEKTPDELLFYSKKILDFFIQQNAKAVVMACNTTSSVIYEKIKYKYPFEIYPIVQIACKKLAELNFSKIGILATNATVNSNVYKKEIKKYNPNIEVIQIACPEWVKIVESNKINEPDSKNKIKEKVDEIMLHKPDALVLGCTHYPYLTDIIKNFSNNHLLIDPAVYFVEYIKNNLQEKQLLEDAKGEEKFYVSSNPEGFKQSARMFYGLKELPIVTLQD